MLVLTRKPGESILINLEEEVDPDIRAADLFAGGPIVVRIVNIAGGQAKVAIEADRRLVILRDELSEE